METECVSCNANLRVRENAYQGEVVECGTCNTELEVTAVAPMTLALAPEPDEDWGE